MDIKKIVIIDYKLGNLFSVNQALINIGLNTIISSNADDIKNASAIVLPGMGAFKDAMDNLKEMELIHPIKKFIENGKPFLGVCLGLQLLLTESEEFGSNPGLGIIKGKVKRFVNFDNNGNRIKVPQIGWNNIYIPNGKTWEKTPFENVSNEENMYFVHSFYAEPDDSSAILSKSIYGSTDYASSVIKNNIFACQFHPEKSAKEGLKIYKNWAVLNQLI